ncbi:MAG: sugar ABC transporter permease [Desulfitobacteriaceae bacterium]|nr:sugar ABC transporter permease [Desulfitobacteriaceae bacterium]MDI6914317.1 sugar ABC transporter permease [Desulfitobacteriaceae bacterium]
MEVRINKKFSIIRKHAKGRKGSPQQRWWTPYLFVTPSFLIVFFIILLPLLFEFTMSTFDIRLQNMMNLKEVGINIFDFPKIFGDQFIGFGNYKEIITSKVFGSVFLRTVIWTVVNVFFHVVLGVWLAVLLNRKLPGKSIFRVLLILPWAIPEYVAAVTWKGMLNYQFGAINALLGKFGIPAINWLGDPTNTLIGATLTNIWLGVPFMMMIALGGLQGIPSDLYEAADIDGATGLQKFRHITAPLLKPVMVPAIILGVVWTFNKLSILYILKDGQPSDAVNILVLKMYRDGFDLYRYGYAAALSVVIFVILAVFSIVYLRANKTSMEEKL